MRGDDKQQGGIFSYRTAEERVPQDHPLRAMRRMVDEALRGLSPRFARMYAKNGRPSIAPERSLRAAVDRATRLQHSLSLVRWARHGRRGVGCDRVHEESRAAVEERSGGWLLRRSIETGAGATVALGRSLHGGRHAD